MRRLRRLIRLCNVYMEHRAPDLLHSSDMHLCIGGGIDAGIGDTDTRPIQVVLANTDNGYWNQSRMTLLWR